MSKQSDILLEHLSAIQQITTALGRRKGMERDEIDDFAGFVRLRLVENDYAIIRAFEERSSFKTYLAAVVAKLFVDYKRRELGKWHDSAVAERLGDAAVELERLLHRDGRSLEEALPIVASHHRQLTREELESLAAQLPPRIRRKSVTIDEAMEVLAKDQSSHTEHAQTASQISKVVREFIAHLPKEDQLHLKLRFDSEMSVTQIAKSLKIDYQSLWRRLQKHYRSLRQELERVGISSVDVETLVGSDVPFDFQLKNCVTRPSEEEESDIAGRQEDMSS